MPKLTIDDKQIDAVPGETVLSAALRNGIYIPHLCYHPALSISGNCRMCMVEIEGSPEISCNLVAKDGMVVLTDTPKVQEMRRSVLEFLLINHPLDCPICDQAGECSLQDYYYKYSGLPSRFSEEKIRRPKAQSISPLIKLDNERCILCARCVRFLKEVTRTNELGVVGRTDCELRIAPLDYARGRDCGFNSQSAIPARHREPEPRSGEAGGRNPQLNSNPYSMNIVDLCPVGALTSADFRFKKRVWFLKSAASVCPTCSTGCNIWVDHEGEIVWRLRPRPNPDVNGFWMCDEGRLAYKEWMAAKRIASPLRHGPDKWKEASSKDAVEEIIGSLATTIIGIASAQLTNEEIDALIEFVSSNGGKIYKTQRTPPNPSEDSFLRHRDKNPNSAHLADLPPLPMNLMGDVLIITDTLSEEDWVKIAGVDWKLVVQIVHDRAMILPEADIVLPRATFLEQAGSFTNHAGLVQEFDRVLEPFGEARSVAEWIQQLQMTKSK